MDYRKFLSKKESLVLPYLGGTSVDTIGRRLRLSKAAPPPDVGWWQFEVSGRTATPVARAEAADMSALPAVRGHHAGGWSFTSGRHAERMHLTPEEPPPLAPVVCRRWSSGDLLFEAVDFEGDAEDEARRRLERDEPLGEVRGATPALRAAYGFALLVRTSRALRIPASAMEVRAHALDVAGAGRPAAEEILRRLYAERHAHRVREIVRRNPPRPSAATRQNAEERAEAALSTAGARMLAFRHLEDHRVEVTFSFMGERFVSIADAISLHIYDSGVCLAGADEEVTLESLPSVLREAIDTDVLVITRY